MAHRIIADESLVYVFPRFSPALLLALPLALAAPANAEKITMGSNLEADATQIVAQGQDTALWPVSVKGDSPAMPEEGQILSVTIKGTVLRERGAANPANLIHFQSLTPEGDRGAMRVWLTSQDFYLPIDEPNAITTFEPENLCVKKGGTVAFNDLGGFMYGGSLTAPLDRDHYHNGAPFQIFAAVRNSVTARYSAHDQTKNGDLLDPLIGTDPGKPNGSINRGQEILMQYVVATGDDRSESCGGPRRHPDGTLVQPKTRELRVAGSGTQRPYVTKNRRFNVGVYCESPDDGCVGSAQLIIADKVRQTRTTVSVGPNQSARLGFRLGKGLFRKLNRAKKLVATLVLTSQWGTVTTPLELHR